MDSCYDTDRLLSGDVSIRVIMDLDYRLVSQELVLTVTSPSSADYRHVCRYKERRLDGFSHAPQSLESGAFQALQCIVDLPGPVTSVHDQHGEKKSSG